jgi:hypothetical protein
VAQIGFQGGGLTEIENRLREIEGKLVDASSQTARFGLFSAHLDAQLRSVRELLAAIEATQK